MNPLTISVVLPTCNRPEFLLQAVESVCSQLLAPGELLVVDDGSDYEVEPALHLFAQHSSFPIRVLEGPRQGPAAARNVGLQAAQGKLIAFLDDDDLWLPQKLLWQEPWFRQRRELGLLGTDCYRKTAFTYIMQLSPQSNEWGKISSKPHPPSPSPRAERGRQADYKVNLKLCGGEVNSIDWGKQLQPSNLHIVTPSALVRANRLTMSSVLARRECFQTSGEFTHSLSLAQDWDMWVRIATHWQVALLPAKLTIYRLHEQQRSARQLAMRASEVVVLKRALEIAAKMPPNWRQTTLRRLSWAHCRLGRAFLRQGQAEDALQELKQSLALFPLQPLAWSTFALCTLYRGALAGASHH